MAGSKHDVREVKGKVRWEREPEAGAAVWEMSSGTRTVETLGRWCAGKGTWLQRHIPLGPRPGARGRHFHDP